MSSSHQQHEEGGGSNSMVVEMQSASAADASDTSPLTPTSPLPPALHQHGSTRSVMGLFGLFAVSFSYALLFSTLSNIVVAKEVNRLAQTSQTTWVGVIMAVGALAQIITPVVGAWSDRAGSRDPFLRAGTVLVVAGVGILYFAGTVSSMVVLFVSQLVLSAGLSVQYAMITVTLHDQVTEEQVGQGSAAMATMGILGAGCGYALFAVGLPLNAIFLAYAATTIVCYIITMAFMSGGNNANNNSNNAAASSGGSGSKTDDHHNDVVVVDDSASGKTKSVRIGVKRFLEMLLHSLTLPSPVTFPDFSLACASRALFNAGLSCQAYLVFFFRDVTVIGTLPPEQVVSRLAVLALLGGLLGAVPAGVLSDRMGKKPVIFLAAGVCICAILSFPILRSRLAFDLIGLLFGVGNVAFLSVDYALGVQSLPRKVGADGLRRPLDAAKDLGVFALSATGGMLIGQLCFAGILERFSSIEPASSTTKAGGGGGAGTAPVSRYAEAGFVVSFAVASVFFAASAMCACMIKTLK